MKQRKMIKEIFPQMYDDYKNGMSILELSQKYDFKPNSIRLYFNKLGIKFSTANKFSDEELDNIIHDYKNGLKPFELSSKYNRNSATIIGKLKTLGIYKNSNYRFTDEDIEFLKKYYPVGDWEIMEKRFPDVPRSSILTKASKLGIRADKFHENRWTEDELNILCENYGKYDMKKMLELLPNRNYSSITTKAQRLNLKTREFWSEEEIEIMKKYYHLNTPDEMMKLLPNRSRNSIIDCAAKLHLVSYCKYSKEETQFIIDNWKTMSDEEMERYLHKLPRSVKGKRLSLGLFRIKEESSYNDLSEYVRKNNLEWKTKSMIHCGYKCVLTGNRFDDIHHIYGLNLILNETLNELHVEIKENINDYTDKELKDILDNFRLKQSEYPLGVCLSKNVHMLFHNTYGYGNNTQEQWNEFVKDFREGKYNEILNVA